MIVLYTRENCAFCTKAKNLLKTNDIEYKELIIGKDVTRDQVIEKFPDRKTLPIVLNDETVVGGYENLVEFVANQSR